ncbi:hypothetical protein [Pedobacter helvus]|uniref:Uncharacterized protein n=1 Tax=Pedobacter helvus TaxID=2563444 RepID=A0ABW9JEI8_9SPHI|nr:hypothetical protein [Pedobacter ureilyticus]
MIDLWCRALQNGVDWTDLGTVVSKVTELTSGDALSYSFSTPIGVAHLLALGS